MSQYDEVETQEVTRYDGPDSALSEQQQSTTVLGALVMVVGTLPIAILGFILSIIALKWIKDVDHPGYARIKGVTKVLAIISIILQGLMILFFVGYIVLSIIAVSLLTSTY
ncbi:hypothetical protein [Alkalicoccobacillus gibsonii]|uniref:hypothetical protein n=1 Tax=Alkalicoccobacillus gibsonii TaxID=79881 RepID=UPI0019311CC2|nr:hypothetical protein [Alkalicoccobacillus gibsonii]MBM0066022.1 hypothetical protein [Alkalicoccobacillus gibsonii]